MVAWGQQPLAPGSTKSSRTPHGCAVTFPCPLPQQLSFSSHIPNATAPQRAQQRNCSGAAQHPCVSGSGASPWHRDRAGDIGWAALSPWLQDTATWRERPGCTQGQMGPWKMLQRSKAPHFPQVGTKFSPCRAAVPAPRPRGGCPAHHLAREADFHKGIHQVLLVALEAEDLPDVVHDGVIHWGGKEMLRNHGGAGCPGCATSCAAHLHGARRVKPVYTSKRLISQYVKPERYLQGLWTKAMDEDSSSVPSFLSGTL